MRKPRDIDAEIERSRDALRVLSKTVLDQRKPRPGPYAFFHYSGHAIAAHKDCTNIMKRLQQGRRDLTQFHRQQDALPAADKTPGPDGVMPPAWNAISRHSMEANELMKLDLESLYVFGGILLDQWSLQAIAVGNVAVAKQHPFRELVDHLDQKDPGILAPLWERMREDMLWLYYQQRFYRNRFVMHANRPWQRGTTASVIGGDFNLYTPTPPGWLDDAALNAEITKLLALAPPHVRNNEHSWKRAPGRLIEILFDRIAMYPRAERETISRLFGQKGGSTPSFHVLGLRLFRFVADATEALIPIAAANIAALDLGLPHGYHDDC